MRIVISGGSGFIGEPLARRLLSAGHDVSILTRDPARVRAGRALAWDPATPGPWRGEVAAADAVVNLAGENVGGGRWTAERKRRIVESRVIATRALVDAMRSAPAQERVFASASAIGFYGDRGDESLTEESPGGAGFLADVTKQWEELAMAAADVARVVILRFGVVLAKGGGALGKMLLPFRLGLGGPIGNGRQWMSWVDRDDVLRAIEWAITAPSARAVYNVTAPEPVRNRDFTRALGAALHRPALLPAPAFALRAVLGEMADEMLLAGQRVLPRRLLAEGFTFEQPALDGSLRNALRG
jgi:uncharacterized protein (TIGR01777 family)